MAALSALEPDTFLTAQDFSNVLSRYTYAIGSNRQAAYHAGVNVKRNLIAVYTLTGLLVGIAAMIATSRTVSAQPTAGQSLELDIIAAVVIGAPVSPAAGAPSLAPSSAPCSSTS